MKKHPDVVKESSRRLSKEEIKKQLIDSFVYNENIDKEDLKAAVNTMEEDYQEAMNIIEGYIYIYREREREREI